LSVFLFIIIIIIPLLSLGPIGYNYHRWPAVMELPFWQPAVVWIYHCICICVVILWYGKSTSRSLSLSPANTVPGVPWLAITLCSTRLIMADYFASEMG